MAQSGFCLWLDGQKIYDIRALREHFDVSVLIGYFIGGGLERWLEQLGETEILNRIRNIDRSKNLGIELAFAFGVRPEPHEAVLLNLDALENGEQLRKEAAKLIKKEEPPKNVKAEEISKPEEIPGSGFLFRSSFFGSFSSFGFIYTSFGSFSSSFGSFRGSFGSFGSFGGAGNLHTEYISGSFRYYAGTAEITKAEYSETLQNLTSCPLNRFGYGINLI